jgi:hypothetical protein
VVVEEVHGAAVAGGYIQGRADIVNRHRIVLVLLVGDVLAGCE